VFILVHAVSGDLVANDLAENGVGHDPIIPRASMRWRGVESRSVHWR
jgi:hypothetical protein